MKTLSKQVSLSPGVGGWYMHIETVKLNDERLFH